MIEKEVRALLPAWTACAVALLASTLGLYALEYFALPIYLLAIAALGSFSIGHEFAYGTLGLALSLPVPRRRIWAAKIGVLLPLIATLAVIAAYRVNLDRSDRTFGQTIFWLPALASVFIAPWLTMVARSPLAGTVFTMSVVGGSMAAGEWIGVARYGYTANVDGFRIAFMWWTVGGLSLVGAVAGWKAFARLEAMDRRGSDVQLLTARPASTSSPAARRRHPFAALVSKELRLQQLSLVIAAIYLTGSVALGVAGRTWLQLYGVLTILTAFYMLILPAVIGSLAAAEERQFGTHDAQLILPMAASRQWSVKAATAIALSVLLALLLPYAIAGIFPMRSLGGFAPRGYFQVQTVFQIVAAACVGLYVSTLARDGLTALMYAIGALIGLAYFTLRVGLAISGRVFELVPVAWRRDPGSLAPRHGSGIWFVLLAVFVAFVLWLALANYRYDDRSRLRIALHAAAVAAVIAVYAAIHGLLMAL